ncbi:GNAT family N-acetyltransferase [Clostridium sp. MD294]|uniref:GNAT family N-acetyltransferase n=1 Tax=Clostridium sp. MD294 TaxID=97138 RepID=UPI0002C92666|nr:GNAT family N-acetyltransferase [Clostridium sp. MD294]NDO45930.1 GNAT family N-acetyltransferase [Clostridium sp. MD294]USF30411.1 Spermine/spermidine acetyltransferase [Clostridium sp. MD294]
MNIHFEAITPKNRQSVENLCLFPEQVNFIESTIDCLKEADEVPQWKPVAIYDECNLIGFAMYGYFDELSNCGELWLDRFLIDKKYQKKGYGKIAISALIQKITKEYHCKKIHLSVYDINKTAIHIYKEIGFYFNGKFDTKGEKIMVYDVF